MKSRKELVFCAVKFEVILVLCFSFASIKALETNGGTVAPLTADQPVSDETITDHKDLKKLETRFHDPPPEYYK